MPGPLLARALTAGLLLLAPAAATAHGTHEDLRPLESAEVALVMDSLAALAAAAAAESWTPGAGSGESLIAAVYAYAAEAGQFGQLPEGTETVLVISEALAGGIVTAEGDFADGFDAFQWYGLFDPANVPAVAAHGDTLDRLRDVFAKGGS